MPRPILVVDDDDQMRIAVAELLTREGYSATVAPNGQTAVEKLHDHHFDLVITDLKMPGMNGLEVLKESKKISPDTPVVLMTAYGTIDNAVEAMRMGASDYLLKPFSSEALEGILRKLNISLTGDGSQEPDSSKIITQDPRMMNLLRILRDVASTEATVLIQGESGTGKELVARFIHQHSPRAKGPFVAINCAALPEGLLESELFGYEKGAFTNAVAQKLGKFEQADGGTLFLDEIAEMSLSLQPKLLRVLQEREVDRIGGRGPVPVNVRVIASTNKPLKKEVEGGRFREDLFYRLNVFPANLLPLREREKDIPLLARHFLERYSSRFGKRGKRLSEEALASLMRWEWKGNVRELEHAIERAILLAEGEILSPQHFLFEQVFETGTTSSVRVGTTVWEMEKALILKTLEQVHGNRTHAARMLGISLRTLRNKLREYREQAGRPGQKLPISFESGV